MRLLFLCDLSLRAKRSNLTLSRDCLVGSLLLAMTAALFFYYRNAILGEASDLKVHVGGLIMPGSMIMGIVAATLVAIAAGFLGSYLGEKNNAVFAEAKFENWPAAKRAALQTGMALCMVVIIAAIGFIGLIVSNHYTQLNRAATRTESVK